MASVTDITIAQPQSNLQASPKIERVPHVLKNNQNNAPLFVPLIVTLGPYHGSNVGFNNDRGTVLKNSLMVKFFNQNSFSIRKSMERVAEIAPQVVQLYNLDKEEESIPEAELSFMMVRDGSALLQFISSKVNVDWADLGFMHYEKSLFTSDLFLLENQIPFIVLEQLMPRDEILAIFDNFISKVGPIPEIKSSSSSSVWLKKKSLFNRIKNTKPHPTPDIVSTSRGQTPLHLLDSLWSHYSLELQPPSEEDNHHIVREDGYTFHSAKELQAAGILFCSSKTSNFNDVRYEKLPFLPYSYLKLPPIVVNDSTKPLLLNLAAYEMTLSQPRSYPVSSYMCFIKSLIHDAEDVRILRRSGIICNSIRSAQVAKFFNDGIQHSMSDPEAYVEVKRNIEAIYTRFWTPWTVFVFIAAVVIALGMGLKYKLF